MTDPTAPPAYLIVGMTMTGDPTTADPAAGVRYGELAQKALARAGAEIEMAGSGMGESLQVLAGEFAPGSLVVERYTSMKGLLDFWNSPEYEEAKPIRRGFDFLDFSFLIAVEGVSTGPGATAKGKSPAYSLVAGVDDAAKVPTTGGAYPLVAASKADIQVLEGTWPYEGGLVVVAHDSIDDAVTAGKSIGGVQMVAVIPEAPENPLG